MNQNFTRFAFTKSIKEMQERYGSRKSIVATCHYISLIPAQTLTTPIKGTEELLFNHML